MKNTILATFLLVLSSWTAQAAVEERIWLEAKVNGKPVRLFFDSGSEILALCPQAAKKLGLRFIPDATNDLSAGFISGQTEDCALMLEGTERNARFLVLDLPAYVSADFDGLIGWWTLRHNVWRIDAMAREIAVLQKVPARCARWVQLATVANSGSLDLQLPHDNRTNGVLCVDTGSWNGLELPPQLWQQWRAAHPANPVTLQTMFTPSDGFLLVEEAWADQITLGPLTFSEVPISQSGRAGTNKWGAQYEGTLGLAVLKRFELIVDGKNGLAYFQPRNGRPPLYDHNRLGAVFVPTTGYTNKAVAHVIQGSPASEAGVRDGDILLQVDDVQVTSWSASWINRFSMKAGTKLRLTLSRDGKVFTTTATLRQILKPSSNKRSEFTERREQTF